MDDFDIADILPLVKLEFYMTRCQFIAIEKEEIWRILVSANGCGRKWRYYTTYIMQCKAYQLMYNRKKVLAE